MTWPGLEEVQEALATGTGKGITVAILDTGVDQSHDALANAEFAPSLGVEERSGHFHATRCEATDPCGHGTAIAGIIHALAPDATLLSVRVLGRAKQQHRHEVIRLGALQALGTGAHILNCSFGMPGIHFTLPIYKSWTDRAFELDRHIVAASSNDDPDAIHWPAYFPQVLSVTNASLPPHALRFRSMSLIAFEASGNDVPVLDRENGSAVMTGSSFAAAHLSGLLARILSLFPALSPSLAHDALRRLAESSKAKNSSHDPNA